MPNRKLTTKRDIEDFVRGCTLLGVGGGGFPQDGLLYLERELDAGNEIEWVDVSEIQDDEWTATAYGMGSTAYRTPEILAEMQRLGMTTPRYERKTAEALKFLEDYTGKTVSVVVPLEIGAANTPDPVGTGVHLRKKVVDGDYAGGRAIPEVLQVSPAFADVPMYPLASVDEWGNRVLIEQALNDTICERLGKLVSTVAFALAGNATYLIPGKRMKELIVPGTLTRSYDIGKAIREARESGRDPVEAVLAVSGGWKLFEGRCTKKDTESREGYFWGTHSFKGTGTFAEHTFKIWLKNENHITWFDDRPYVTSPDIITVVDAGTCEPTINPDVAEGKDYVVLGMTAHKLFRSERGLAVLSPKYFGFDMEYRPIEQVVGD
ncbi:DUF917 domain-containing protein [Candidatus Bipolaricaulota bacterium]|nr:DUF917 domain-containing protein [Candidatus Bipolaricaulota bacterium]